MKTIFQKNLQFGDIWPRNRQKNAQIEVFGHFLDFASSVFFDCAHNDRWAWYLVVFLQFAGPVNAFLFFIQFQSFVFDFSFINFTEIKIIIPFGSNIPSKVLLSYTQGLNIFCNTEILLRH